MVHTRNCINSLLPTIALVATCFAGCSGGGPSESAGGDSGSTLTIGVMPKLVGIDFFNAVEKGALEAGKELDVNVVYDGPVVNDVTKQSALVESWIARKFDAIAIAPNDPETGAVNWEGKDVGKFEPIPD